MDLDPNITALRRLQREDRRMVNLERQLGATPARLKELDLDLAQLAKMLDSERAKLEETRRFRHTQDELLHDEEEQIRAGRSRMSNVKNQRELHATQREIEITQRMAKARGDEITRIEEAIEVTAAKIAEMEVALATLTEQVEKERKRLGDESAVAREQLEKLREQRTRLLGAIEPDVLRRYERIRERSAGVAFVPARNRRCGACKMLVAHQHYVILRRGNEILPCENCGRLLYWAGHFSSDADGPAGAEKDAKSQITAPAKRTANR